MQDLIPVPHVQQQINQPNLQLDIPRQFDDISILREISKKYILIPKSRTFIPDNYVVPPPPDNKPELSEPKSYTVDNGDWRSKYDILEQLKNKEKDNIHSNKKEAPENNMKNYEMQNQTFEDLPNKYETELPEKELPSNKFLVENYLAAIDNLKITDIPANPETNIVQFQKSPEINSNTCALAEQIPNIESNAIEHNVPIVEEAQYDSHQEQNTVNDKQKVQEYAIYNEGDEQLAEYQNYPNEYEQQNPEAIPHQEITPQSQENDIYVNQNDYSPIQTVNPSELVQEIHNEPEVKDDRDTAEIEYPIDVINVAEFTPEDNVQLQDGFNINPEYVPIQKPYEQSNVGEYVPSQETYYEQPNAEGYGTSNIEINDQQNIAATSEHADNSGIEAFDAEQKEMFYSEQQDEYAYHQQAAGEAYEPEYVPNEQYQENPDYTYYGQVDQQEDYPVEINEHEETNQRYDPNYEQQYAPTQQQDYVDPQFEPNQQQFEHIQQQFEQNQQQYIEPQVPEQFEQQYAEPALYEQMQQGYEQYVYEQENKDTMQDVEEVMDQEEGYVAENKVAKQTKENN